MAQTLKCKAEATERRAVTELRADGRRLTGYAATWDRETRIGSFTEVIRRGAFNGSLERDIVALVDHDATRLLARTRTGTLTLTEDERGLAFDIQIPDTQTGRDVLALAERGDLGGMSFGFRVPEGGERWTGRKRELVNLDLREISVVHAWPAYDGTEVQARSRTPLRDRLTRYLETV